MTGDLETHGCQTGDWFTPVNITHSAPPVHHWRVLLSLTAPPRLRLTIERGSYSKAVVRTFFEDADGRRSCLDSKLMSRTGACALARRIAVDGVEVEVVAWRYNCVRPAPWEVRRAKRLDAHRLNRVPRLISAESMFSESLVTMDEESES